MVIGPTTISISFTASAVRRRLFMNEDNEIAGTINASFFNTAVNNDTLNIIYSLARLYETLVLKKADFCSA
jgi:hypothetical protein